MKKRNVYLTGFMGAGKSTIGPILANTIGWDYFDVDLEIENKIKRKIVEIFESDGEEYFREIERETIKNLSKGNNLIISLGGGAIAYRNNIDFLKQNGVIIYLKVSPAIVFERLKSRKDRPLLLSGKSENESKQSYINNVERLIESREVFYNQADYTFSTDNISIGKVVDKLAKLISNPNFFLYLKR